MKIFKAALALLLIVSQKPGFTAPDNEISVSDIVQHLGSSSFTEITDYIVQIHAELNMEDVQIPPMDVKVYFRKPDKVHLESEGFAMLPREGLFINPGSFNEDNFYISFAGKDTIQAQPVYKLDLIPKKDEIKVKKMSLWVSNDEWLVMKISATGWQGHVSKIAFEYKKIDDKYHLPISAEADISMPGRKRMPPGMNDIAPDEKDKSREGKLLIQFSNYKINSGFSDKIFEDQF